MDSSSLSSASKAASKAASAASKSAASAAKSGTSQAANAASQASASLASGAAKASSYAGNTAGTDTTTKKAAGMFALSNLTLTGLAIAIGAAYYYGYLDGLIAYIQTLLSQAQDQKERVLKENTGQTSVRAVAKDKYNEAAAQGEDMVNQLRGEAQKQQTGTTQSGNDSTLFSSAAH